MTYKKQGHLSTQCGIHGIKYFVFKQTGPCMHPDCAQSRIKLWAATDENCRRVFNPVMNDLYEFVVWGMTTGEKALKFRWGSKEAWINAVPSFLRDKRLERARAATATENSKLLFYANSQGSNGTGSEAGRTVFPDSHLWVRECCLFLSSTFGEPMTAYFLDIIDLFDLAKLCYSGDVIRAKQEALSARQQLKDWCFGG